MKKRDKELLLLSLAFLFVNMGWGIAWPQLPNYMELLGGGVVMVASLSILFNIFSTVGQYFWGRKSDEMKRRKPFVIFGVVSGGAFFFAMAFATNAMLLLTLRTVQGFFMSAQTPAVSALISEISVNIGRGFAIFNGLSNGGFMLGNLVGGIIMDLTHNNYTILYLLSSLPFLVAILLLSLIKEPKKVPMDYRLIFRIDRPGRILVKWKKAREFVKRNRNITIVSFSVFIAMISSGMVYSFLSILIKLRFTEAWASWYFALDSGISIIFVYLLGYAADKLGSKPVIIMGLIGYALTFLLYYLANTLPLLILASAISGFKWAAYFNSINTYISRMSLRHERATALGIMNSAMAMGWVIGPLIGMGIISFLGRTEQAYAVDMLLGIVPAILALIVVMFAENDKNVRDGIFQIE